MSLSQGHSKIGITITKSHTFSNGMNQNAIFLYLVCKNLGYECDLLSHEESHDEIVYNNIPVKRISEDETVFNTSHYKAIITVTGRLSKAISDKCKKSGTIVIGYTCSNQLCMAIEATATAHSRSIIIGREAANDKGWILDSFPFMKTYYELLCGVKSQYVPHVWNSELVEYYCKHINQKDPKLLVYDPKLHTQKKLTLLIPESNVNFVKTAIVPLMAAEKLHSINPELIDEIFIFSYPTESTSLEDLVSKLQVGKKVRKFTRQLISDILTHFNTRPTVPVFTCHHIYTPLNYSYYELMYFGFPFVHNSELLKEYGHFYTDLDIDMCAVQIFKAYMNHAVDFDAKIAKNRNYLETIDPNHPRCLERWKPIVAAALE